jgi:hypothetical protein
LGNGRLITKYQPELYEEGIEFPGTPLLGSSVNRGNLLLS